MYIWHESWSEKGTKEDWWEEEIKVGGVLEELYVYLNIFS